MAERPVPRPGQLIAAGVGSALLCLPIYALLTIVAFASTSLAGTSVNRPSVLEVVGTMFMAVPFSLLGIVIWPISLLVASMLFALGGRLLVPRFDEHRFRRWIWAGAGALVGTLTGIVMAVEMTWRSSFPFDGQTNFGTIPFAIPTGVFGMLICGKLIRRTVSGPGRYVSHRY